MSGQPADLHPVNPATGEPLPAVSCTAPEAVCEMIAAARRAQAGWADRGVEARATGLQAFAARLAEPANHERLARTITQEMGKPIRYSRSEVSTVANRIDGFVDRAREAVEVERTGSATVSIDVQWRPLGVAAVIAPWNYPLSTPNSLVLSALLTGNGVVFKPSEITPRTGAIYHELLAEALPEGLVGLVQGRGDTGAALVAGDVDLIAFTGSIRTGQTIMREAAAGMKRLVLELGGKDPMLVFPGADLDAAARHAAEQSLRNSGQVCVAVERVLLHSEIAEEFTERLCRVVEGLAVGDPMDPSTEIGPMVSAPQRRAVLDQLRDARERGASFLIEGASYGPGFFLSPSVVCGVTQEMLLGTQETFGPVVALSSFDDTEEALRLANGTCYGLGASVWGAPSGDLDAIAGRIDAGMVGINRGLSAAGGAPWVGWKLSGFGHTRSKSGMRQFMQPRTLARSKGAGR